MQLRTTTFEHNAPSAKEEIVVLDSPNFEEVCEAFERVDWQEFGAIELIRDPFNKLEASGGVGDFGGLCLSLLMDAVEILSIEKHSNTNSMLPYFEVYLTGDRTGVLRSIFFDESLSDALIWKRFEAEREEAVRAFQQHILPRARKSYRKGNLANYVERLAPVEPLLDTDELATFRSAREQLS